MNTVVSYKGININIERTGYSENPFENWDGMMPLMYESDRTKKDYSESIYDYLEVKITDGQLIFHQHKLIELLKLNESCFEDLRKLDKISELRDAIREATIEELADVLSHLKIKHFYEVSRGYSKSDYAELLVVPTYSFIRESECTFNSITEESMESVANLWSSWAWGDVYSYYIGEDDLEDSCAGFYGDDHEKSGLLGEAQSTIDFYLEKKKKNRESKLKILIKNKVPLNTRQEVLKSI